MKNKDNILLEQAYKSIYIKEGYNDEVVVDKAVKQLAANTLSKSKFDFDDVDLNGFFSGLEKIYSTAPEGYTSDNSFKYFVKSSVNTNVDDDDRIDRSLWTYFSDPEDIWDHYNKWKQTANTSFKYVQPDHKLDW
jgi:hypothetical protein